MFALRLLLLIAAVAQLAACAPLPAAVGGFNPASGPPLASNTPRRASQRNHSWLSAKAQRETLLYVSDFGTQSVTIYSTSGGGSFQLVGELFGFQAPGGECTDAHGNIFIADLNAAVIYEYAHGSVTPKAAIPDHLGQPYTCAIDRKTGRLAVTNLSNPSGGEPGNVIVYPSPSGTPTEYSDSHLNEPLFCSFDGKGNLFLDAYDSSFHALLSELPNGSQSFVTLTLSGGTINIPGGVQSDGSQLLVADNLNPKNHIYEINVSGSTATVLGTIPLNNSQTVVEFTEFGSGSSAAIAAADYDGNSVPIYSFPGGSLLSTISGTSEPFGAVLSQGSAK